MYLGRLCVAGLVLLVISSCASTQPNVEQYSEISEESLERLAMDLVVINTMAEDARRQYEKEILLAKVVEPWTETTEQPRFFSWPSGTKKWEVMTQSKIEVPWQDGLSTVDIVKYVGDGETLFGVAREIMEPQAGWIPESKVEGQKVKWFDVELSEDPISYKAILEYIAVSSSLQKATDKILKKLTEMKNTYENSPIYIEGFDIHFPLLIQVSIHFKFKTN